MRKQDRFSGSAGLQASKRVVCFFHPERASQDAENVPFLQILKGCSFEAAQRWEGCGVGKGAASAAPSNSFVFDIPSGL